MTVCSNTGISVPECSCRCCLQAQIERHQPSLLNADPANTPPTVEMPAVAVAPIRPPRRHEERAGRRAGAGARRTLVHARSASVRFCSASSRL